jgi:hypothetical protein
VNEARDQAKNQVSQSETNTCGGIAFLMAPLFVFCCWQSFESEKRALQTQALVAFATKHVQPISNGGARLVYASGPIHASSPVVRDSATGFEARSLRLLRNVSMYSWIEHDTGYSQKARKHVYSYTTEWVLNPTGGGNLRTDGYSNPSPVIFNDSFDNQATLDGRNLPAEVLSKLPDSMVIPMDQSWARKIESIIKQHCVAAHGEIFVGWEPQHPKVGDLRIKYTAVPIGTASVIAQDDGGTLRPYPVSGLGQLCLIEPGIVDAATMLRNVGIGNDRSLWSLRFVWFGLIWLTVCIFSACLRGLRWEIPVICEGPMTVFCMKASVFAGLVMGSLYLVASVSY